jgi:hypothetical protein
MKDEIPEDRCFAELARRQSISPDSRPAHGAQALELVSLITETEELGDLVLQTVRSGQMDHTQATRLLKQLLKCYSKPLIHTRLLAQTKIELGKLKP